MKLPGRLRSAAPPQLVALLVLLALLGTLQYRWAGALSQAEWTRMRVGAQARADAFAQDFDREITRVFLRLSLDGESLRKRDFSSFAQRYERWRHSSSHPEWVAGVYLIEPGAGDERHVSQFRPERATFEPVAWPAVLVPLGERVAAWGRGGGPEERGVRSGPISVLADGTTALVNAVFPAAPEDRPPQRAWLGAMRPPGFVVVLLDDAYLRGQLLPALAEKHFGGTQGLEYDLTVARQDDSHATVWQSDRGKATGNADATASLLELRLDEATENDLREMARPRMGMGQAVFTRRFEPGDRAPGTRLPRPGRWRLSASHRAGSLDAVVAAARIRNLTVSFGILILLGASVVLMVASARRAERLARRQIEFVAGVTHELRTPLAVIRSAGENLADGLVGEPAEVRSYGALVRDEGRRLTDMVEQVLELAGAESGRQTATRKPLQLARSLEDALAECRAHASASTVRTEKDLAADLPQVLGDETALRRVWRNLLDNAIKYGGEPAWIGVRTRVREGARGQEVAVIVEDQGLGIPPEERAHVFEPFYRGRDATERQIKGNGLGLSLVRRIVESHGGQVTLEARREGGTAFTVTFPALPPTAGTAS